MKKDKDKNKDQKNQRKCGEIGARLKKVNAAIKAYEDKIRYSQKAIKDWDREKRQNRAEMKNNMTKLGKAKDLVVNTLIPIRSVAIATALYDSNNSPEVSEINNQMNKIKDIENKIKNREHEIFRIGVELRERMKERDDLMRELRYSECGSR
jgi:chromosome segregation ATPase